MLAHIALVLLLSFLAFALSIFSPIMLGVGQQADVLELSYWPGSIHNGTRNNLRYQIIDKPWHPSLKFLIPVHLMKEINKLFTIVK